MEVHCTLAASVPATLWSDTLRSLCPSRLIRAKVQVKPQWSCSQVQVTRPRVHVPSISFDVNANQAERRIECKNVKMSINTWRLIESLLVYITNDTVSHIQPATRQHYLLSNSNKSVSAAASINPLVVGWLVLRMYRSSTAGTDRDSIPLSQLEEPYTA